jgi:hypothetical protein
VLGDLTIEEAVQYYQSLNPLTKDRVYFEETVFPTCDRWAHAADFGFRETRESFWSHQIRLVCVQSDYLT